MKRSSLLVLVLVALVAGPVRHNLVPSQAAAKQRLCPSPCLAADGDAFAGSAGSSSAGGRPSGRAAGRPIGFDPVSPFRSEVRYVPTCSGNSVGGEDVLCTAAVELCPQAGDVRVWVFRREVDTRVANHDPSWLRENDPPSRCLGAEDPALDPRIAIAAIVQRDFQRVVVLKGAAQVSPQPDTLVNIATRFSTDAPASYDIPLTLLGQQVTITAIARRWTWQFGDGTSASTTKAGTQGRVEHVYRTSTSLGAHVVIEWSGTYRIGAGPTLPITGTATTVGDATLLSVKQARTDLVHESS